MDWETIWLKIQQFALMFFDFAMNEGENKFMLVDKNIIYGKNLPNEVIYFFVGSFVTMVLLAICASDSFQLLHPINGIREWNTKISIIKVVFFSAAVFSFHTFYKMLITLTGSLVHAQPSIDILRCLGTYINPISVMIYAYAISTMDFRKKNIQAMFLGWAIFLTPAAMSYSNFTREHIMLYVVSASFGIIGGILYKKCSPFLSYFVLSIVYFIDKFFMIYYSEEMLIISSESWIEKIEQYFACIHMDFILTFILIMILMGYKDITAERGQLKIKRDIVIVAVMAVCMIGTFFANKFVVVNAVQLAKAEPSYHIEKIDDETDSTEIELNNDPITIYVITSKAANIRSGPSTDYEVLTTALAGNQFSGTGNVETAKNGRLWYEIYINDTETGWASEAVIEKREKYPIDNLIGVWNGDANSVLTLNENGECYYVDGSSGKGAGTWYIDEQAVLHVNTDALSYEIYATLNDGYNTTSMTLESDSGSWRDEVFEQE